MKMSSVISAIASTSGASAQRLVKRKGDSRLLSRPCVCALRRRASCVDNTIESKSGQCKMKVDNPTIVILMNTYPSYAKSRICTH